MLPALLAVLCDVSDRTLRRFFSQWTGLSPQRWLDELRLWESILMLMDGCLVKEISAEFGFRNRSQFSVSFKRRFGLSPSWFLGFRRAMRATLEATLTWPAISCDGNGPANPLIRLEACVKERLHGWISAGW